MNKIHTIHQLRDEITRLKAESKNQKAAIRTSFDHLKNSLTPLNIIISIVNELDKQKMFKTAVDIFSKARDFFKRK
jgi:hypothetical protein